MRAVWQAVEGLGGQRHADFDRRAGLTVGQDVGAGLAVADGDGGAVAGADARGAGDRGAAGVPGSGGGEGGERQKKTHSGHRGRASGHGVLRGLSLRARSRFPSDVEMARSFSLGPGVGRYLSTATTWACTLPSTAWAPNRRRMASAARAVAPASPPGSRASISFRSGVPWQ